MVIELDRDNYESQITKAGGLVLVDFWGPQCRPCLALTPVVEKLEKGYSGKISVAKLDVSHNRMLCARLRVISLPTFLLYKDGVEIKRLTGEDIKESDIVAAIEEVID